MELWIIEWNGIVGNLYQFENGIKHRVKLIRLLEYY